MRYYVKVADVMCGVGFTRGFWLKKNAEKEAELCRQEYGNAVWVVTRKEKKERLAL